MDIFFAEKYLKFEYFVLSLPIEKRVKLHATRLGRNYLLLLLGILPDGLLALRRTADHFY